LNEVSYREISANGLWHNNPGLVQLLGLCPLLAISGTVVNALGLGIATTLTLVASNVTVSLIRHWVRPEIRIPVFVLIIASVVTGIELAMNAFFYELYLVLGIFIPLIVTNCAIIGRAEAFASKNPIPKALADGLAMGLGFTGVLVALGALREVVGHGTLLADAHLMFGEAARDFSLTVISEYRGFLLALLPPGAFIALGLIIALKNIIDSGLEKRAAARVSKPAEALG
jgi:Na+-translocating ferredoxin:NAD+ oxidoreductase subunit E